MREIKGGCLDLLVCLWLQRREATTLIRGENGFSRFFLERGGGRKIKWV